MERYEVDPIFHVPIELFQNRFLEFLLTFDPTA